jgi:hypothetical protein
MADFDPRTPSIARVYDYILRTPDIEPGAGVVVAA